MLHWAAFATGQGLTKQCHDECGAEMWTVMSCFSGSLCLPRLLSLQLSWSVSHDVSWFLNASESHVDGELAKGKVAAEEERVVCLCVCVCPMASRAAGKQQRLTWCCWHLILLLHCSTTQSRAEILWDKPYLHLLNTSACLLHNRWAHNHHVCGDFHPSSTHSQTYLQQDVFYSWHKRFLGVSCVSKLYSSLMLDIFCFLCYFNSPVILNISILQVNIAPSVLLHPPSRRMTITKISMSIC